MMEKRVYYKSDKMTVSFAPKICIHAAECVKGLPSVFDTSKKPWVNVPGANPDEIIEVINMCPSGALKYELIDFEQTNKELEMEKTKITVMPNGPIMVEGNLEVKKMNGEELKQADKIFLCRCGHSSNKPFCDGSHKKEGFTAE
jgi:uncharacterized Fe-S cluster protein YjdI